MAANGDIVVGNGDDENCYMNEDGANIPLSCKYDGSFYRLVFSGKCSVVELNTIEDEIFYNVLEFLCSYSV